MEPHMRNTMQEAFESQEATVFKTISREEAREVVMEINRSMEEFSQDQRMRQAQAMESASKAFLTF
jgi:hypothetical protein